MKNAITPSATRNATTVATAVSPSVKTPGSFQLLNSW